MKRSRNIQSVGRRFRADTHIPVEVRRRELRGRRSEDAALSPEYRGGSRGVRIEVHGERSEVQRGEGAVLVRESGAGSGSGGGIDLAQRIHAEAGGREAGEPERREGGERGGRLIELRGGGGIETCLGPDIDAMAKSGAQDYQSDIAK